MTMTTTTAMMVFPHMQGLDFGYGTHENQAPHLLQATAGSITSGNFCGTSNSSSYHDHFPAAISDCSMTNPVEYECDLGGGDLFKAPEPVAAEPPDFTLDPVSATLSLMSGGDLVAADVNALVIAGMEPIGSGHLLSEFNLYECGNDIVVPPNSESFTELLDVEAAATTGGTMQKSVSSCRLDSMDQRKGKPPRPSFLGFEEMGLDEAAIGMRRARSDGDIQTVGSGSGATIVSQNALHPSSASAVDKFKSEERRQKLSRYRNKRERRNFGRKIKYACRKALADNQLRVRGRFAKIKEHRVSRPDN